MNIGTNNSKHSTSASIDSNQIQIKQQSQINAEVGNSHKEHLCSCMDGMVYHKKTNINQKAKPLIWAEYYAALILHTLLIDLAEI